MREVHRQPPSLLRPISARFAPPSSVAVGPQCSISRRRPVALLLHLSIFVATLSCCSCGSAASVRLQDGSYVNGRILKGSRETVWVQSFGGSIVRVPRRQVDDVDHPGTAILIVGSALTATAVAVATHNALTCEDTADMYGRNCEALGYVLMAPVFATGAGMGLWGLATQESSRMRFQTVSGSVSQATSYPDGRP